MVTGPIEEILEENNYVNLPKFLQQVHDRLANLEAGQNVLMLQALRKVIRKLSHG